MYVCMLHFDEHLEGKLNELRRQLDGAGVPPMDGRPHITLFATPDLNVPRFEDKLAAVVDARRPFPVLLSAVGSFPGPEGAVLLIPAPSESMLRIQRAVFDAALAADAQPTRYSIPDAWFPHTTLALDSTRVLEGLEIAREAIVRPYSGLIESVSLVEFPEVNLICVRGLNPAAEPA